MKSLEIADYALKFSFLNVCIIDWDIPITGSRLAYSVNKCPPRAVRKK